MGEIAEMMLDGMLCEACGVAFDPDHEPPGHPVYCSVQCAMDRGVIYAPSGGGLIRNRRKVVVEQIKSVVDHVKCPECDKVFAKKADRRKHIKMKHGERK